MVIKPLEDTIGNSFKKEENMLDIILKIALFLLVILQIVAMIFIIIVNRKTLKKDTEFYDRLNKEMDESNHKFQEFLDSYKQEYIEDEQTKDSK